MAYGTRRKFGIFSRLDFVFYFALSNFRRYSLARHSMKATYDIIGVVVEKNRSM